MKIVLDTDVSKLQGLPVNSVMLYDGKKWYITTKEDLFKEFYTRLSEISTTALRTSAILTENYDKLAKDFERNKKEVASQIASMAEIIETYVK